ncbi:MAG: tryptophan synthase subunit alpha [Canidatus Methanoxibalbensis ujae]|nr:tryptophan synthase subunit alpha [Candidatus Methanoxibalbensis ujae]
MITEDINQGEGIDMAIERVFERLRREGERALIGFITAGYPSAELTPAVASALIDGGVDILEIGLPFSDPIADGVTIQRASEHSLKAGMNTDLYFEVASQIKGVEKVCLSYYNLVLRRKTERFIEECISAGISGIIVPDLPVEEASDMLKASKNYDFDVIFLVSPTTTERRIAKILNVSSGFIYVVSLLGVTGVRERLSDAISPTIHRIRRVQSAEKISIPVAVGFGISREDHVRAVCEIADGAIVGSAFIKIMEEHMHSGELKRADKLHAFEDTKNMLADLKNFAQRLKKATHVALCSDQAARTAEQP